MKYAEDTNRRLRYVISRYVWGTVYHQFPRLGNSANRPLAGKSTKRRAAVAIRSSTIDCRRGIIRLDNGEDGVSI